MKNAKNRITAFLLALLFQTCMAGLIFIGGLLDPLLGLWVAGIYFFVIGTYLIYFFCKQKMNTK